MTAGKRWVAAGASAMVLAGGLVVGAPAAVAAPGDPACLQATAQFDAGLAASGITPESLAAFEQSSEALAAARAQYTALVESAGGPTLQELEAAGLALTLAQQSGDPQAVAQAEARVLELEAALAAALGSVDPAVAEQALTDATAVLDALLAELGLDEAAAGQLLVLLGQVAAACEGTGTGTPVVAPAPAPAPVPPVVAPAPAPVPPVVAPAAPVQVAPAPAVPVEAAPAPAAEPVAVNPGLNMQTGAAQPEGRPGVALLAALLVAGAVPAGAGAWRNRRRRARG